ncbi:MAG: methyltransferase domain-containing protein [Candidatus Thorarchaeota archaeon]
MNCSRCSQCIGIEMEFDQKLARKELQKYRDKGPIEKTRMLIDALKAEGISGMTLLDVGGGIGAIQHELLKAGVSSCINVEVSQAYIEAAKEEASRQGHGDRITHLLGDFVDLAVDIPQCDIVTLDRVVCCYHDVKSLVEKSAVKTKALYGLVYPQSNWKARFAGFLENIYHRLNRSPFRFFVHPTEVVEEILRTEGFEQQFYQESGSWQIVLYRRIR